MDASIEQGRYALKQVIGRGAYGVVYRAVNRSTNRPCAIKQIQFEDESELNEHMLEIDLLKNLRHENIVEYRGFIQKSHELYILLEYCSRGSLRDLLKKGPLLEVDTVNYIRQTLQGLRYLHEQGVIHRDIKAANLLLTEEGVVKLADFGVSTRINRMAMTYAGSPNWMAPEVMTGQGASTVSDVWSLGATVVELLTGNPPFHNLVNESACYAIVNEEYIPPLTLSVLCRDFLSKCFQKNMFKRATAQELLEHVWLQQHQAVSKRDLSEYVEKDDKWDKDFILDSNNDMTPSPTKSPTPTHLKLSEFEEMTVDQLFVSYPLDAIVARLINSLQNDEDSDVADRALEIFKYDKKFNHSNLKDRFIEIGGVAVLISSHYQSLLTTYFDREMKLLIKCGILYRMEILTDSRLIVLIAYNYKSVTSQDLWNQWCLKFKDKIGLCIINELMSTKYVEAEKLLIYVSQIPEFPLNVLKLITFAKKYKYLQHCIFITLNNILKRSASSLPTSNMLHGKFIYQKYNFPSNVTQWLVEMIPDVKQKAMEQFVELCFHVCHLNNKSISQLMENDNFLELTKSLLKSHNNNSLVWCLSLCSECFNELDIKNISTMIEIGVSSLTIPNCLSNSIEIILNCFNLAQQLNLPIVVDSHSIIILEHKIPFHLLVHSFYQDNGRYDKFITKYTKLCSLPIGKKICYEILKEQKFIGRIHELFDRFKTSLIIQIDLLKFLKVFIIQITQEEKNTYIEKLAQLSQFLRNNWISGKTYTPIKYTHQRVGADSVLIQQLCHDIQKLI